MRKLFLQAFLFVAAVGCGNADGPAGQPMVPAEPGICTLIGCTSGATYSGSISLNGQDLAMMQATRCINGSCESAAVRPVAGTTNGFTCSTASRFFCDLTLAQDKASASLLIEMPAPTGSDPLMSLQDGDQYDVTIGIPNQPPALKLSTTAKYLIIRPNGSSCAPTCKQVPLLPSA